MRRSIWMNAWDLLGREPGHVVDQMRGHGLNACSLGLSYHGGRMLLPCNSARVAYEQHPGALYFNADIAQFPAALAPAVASEAPAVTRFLEECERSAFPVSAWLVLCHHDRLPDVAQQCAIRNAFGEAYTHALCPANATVQDYCAELCRQAAALPGVTALDLEALSFLGYEHGGLHDKRGLPMKNGLEWLLSICCCDVCAAALPGVAESIRKEVRLRLDEPYGAHGTDFAFDARVLAWREGVQMRLVQRVRQAAGAARLNVRLAQQSRFSGGKCTLPPQAIAGIADEATFTYFGSTVEAMCRGLANLSPVAGLGIHAGFVFHEPDCSALDHVLARTDLIAQHKLDGAAFYSFSLAARPHWKWLKQAIQEKLI